MSLSPTQSLRLVRDEIEISSLSGNSLRATVTEVVRSRSPIGLVMCPGFGVGKEGEFVRTTEETLLKAGLARWSVRFNFSGHGSDYLSQDLTGFTFAKAVKDFEACAAKLRAQGAKTIVAICSSTGTQSALLAACNGSACVDAVIGRASIVDCFQGIMSSFPVPVRSKWQSDGAFHFPVGGTPVKLSAELLSDIASWDLASTLSKLSAPVFLIHGSADQTSRLDLVKKTMANAPSDRVTLHELPGCGHELDNNPSSPASVWILEQLKRLALSAERT